uniref:Protein archease n=1 Tax=Taeniopygia guttata TaxID=59729 RepID=A0A674HPM6_TAEGU
MMASKTFLFHIFPRNTSDKLLEKPGGFFSLIHLLCLNSNALMAHLHVSLGLFLFVVIQYCIAVIVACVFRLHAWGDTLEEAFEQCAMAMFGYMTDTGTVEPVDTVEVEAEGHDLLSLLFHFLDEWLYKFSADEFFIPREVKVLHIDRRQFKIRSIGWGEEFSLAKHPQGTEVKAITYSAMQICEDEKPEVFVIIDI